MTRFVLRAASSLIWGGGGGDGVLLFHFIQSKVVGLQETWNRLYYLGGKTYIQEGKRGNIKCAMAAYPNP